MELLDAIACRHSVRSYLDKALSPEIIERFNQEIDDCNENGNLSIRLVINDNRTFDGFLARYGKFHGVHHYLALIGPKSKDLDERAGYYGERLVLLAQQLGLNTCWVAVTFNRAATQETCEIGAGEKLVCVIALGYGATQGMAHKGKPASSFGKTNEQTPQWFHDGINCVTVAPSMFHQQKCKFFMSDGKVVAKSTGGFFQKVDLGIAKYHFEIGAGKHSFEYK